MLTQPENRFDEELATWLFRRGGRWMGTASELLTSVENCPEANNTSWPRSSRELYDHLHSHGHELESLGVYVLLLQGVPRMVSLRSRKDDGAFWKISSSASGIDSLPDPQSGPPSTASGGKERASVTVDHDQAELGSDLPRTDVNRQYAMRQNFGGRVFEDTGEALVAIGEMRQRIREKGLGLESAVNAVIKRAKEITGSCGITVELLPQPKGDRPLQIFGSSSFEGLRLNASLFEPSLRSGEVVAVEDAQEHPLTGAECRRAGVASLIILPIFRDREVVGAMQFLFREKLDFSPGEVMDLGLVAGVISESFGDSPQIVAEAEGPGSPSDNPSMALSRGDERTSKKQGENIPVRGEKVTKPMPHQSSSPESAVLNSLVSSKPGAAPILLWRALKKAWTGHSRHV